MLYFLTLNWNGEDKLKSLYESIIPNIKDINYRWLIKDNASKDNSVALIEGWNNTKIELFKYQDNNQNFSEGMNYLFNKTNANDDDIICLLNNDVIVNDNKSIPNMLKIFKDKNVGVVGAKLLFTNTNKIQHCGVCIDHKYKMPYHLRSNQITDARDNRNREFQAITGAVMMVRKICYENICTTNKSGINGLDENFRWAFDDIDACLSIRYNQNKKIIYCGETNFFHQESATLKKNPVNKLFMQHNTLLFRQKWAERIFVDQLLYENNSNHNIYGK